MPPTSDRNYVSYGPQVENSVDRLDYCNDFWPVLLPCCMECRRGLAIRILSVRLSVKRVNCDKMEEKSVQIFITYERSFSLIFWENEWFVGSNPFNLKFWVNRPPTHQKGKNLDPTQTSPAQPNPTRGSIQHMDNSGLTYQMA